MALPWDRLPGESGQAYTAFCLYRDLGPRRSLDEASRRYHSTAPEGDDAASGRRPRASGRIRRWAERWNWNARALAWDQELERLKRREQVEAEREMNERHAKESMMLQNKAIERLRQLRPEELRPRDLLAFLVEALKLERLTRGQPTDRIAEEHHFVDLKELSDEELVRIIASGQGPALPPCGPRAISEKTGQKEPP